MLREKTSQHYIHVTHIIITHETAFDIRSGATMRNFQYRKQERVLDKFLTDRCCAIFQAVLDELENEVSLAFF